MHATMNPAQQQLSSIDHKFIEQIDCRSGIQKNSTYRSRSIVNENFVCFDAQFSFILQNKLKSLTFQITYLPNETNES